MALTASDTLTEYLAYKNSNTDRVAIFSSSLLKL